MLNLDEERELLHFLAKIEAVGPDRFLATCDDLNAVASGSSPDEALANLTEAIGVLCREYPHLVKRAAKSGVVADAPDERLVEVQIC